MSRDLEPTVFVAGHHGMVGSAIVRRLKALGYSNILTATRDELDLTDQAQVKGYLELHAIDQVYLAAAKVGGIQANNTYPAEFIYQNLMIEANLIHAAHQAGVQKLLFLGSSCIYPKLAEQPMREEALLTGTLEPTNEPYAIAKIAGIKLCESYNRQYGRDYRSVMPTNLYGPHDNFHPENSHVIPALLRRFHEAKQQGEHEVVVWGSGKPMREFLHVDDMAAASVHVMELERATHEANTSPMLSHINVGTGVDCTIRELAETVKRVTGFEGELTFDAGKPDGTPRKLMDVSRLKALGWQASITLEDGLQDAYRWFLDKHVANVAIHRATPGERASFYLSRHCTTDHVCRNSSCLNPGHLQFVPNSENIFRISVPDLSDTIPCFIEDCSFEVRCTWPVGFNVCQACGGKAPYVYVIEQPKQMELFNSELQIRSRVLPKPIPVERVQIMPKLDQTLLEVGATD